MPYNLWILPLVSGYFFITNYDYYKYEYQRLNSKRLIFHSIITGILLFLFVYTLKNNKVYVGFTEEIPPPHETNYLKIIPIVSGYRDSETKQITFTTEYYNALDYYGKNPEKYNNFDMDIIIKQNEILTAGIFDSDIYEQFL